MATNSLDHYISFRADAVAVDILSVRSAKTPIILIIAFTVKSIPFWVIRTWTADIIDAIEIIYTDTSSIWIYLIGTAWYGRINRFTWFSIISCSHNTFSALFIDHIISRITNTKTSIPKRISPTVFSYGLALSWDKLIAWKAFIL